MSKIAVVTAITAGKDTLIEYQDKYDNFTVYADDYCVSNTWKHKTAYDRFVSSRRNSRIHKILIHQYVSADYSIWIDGNIRMNVSPEQVVDEWLKNHNVAAFKHPWRDCIYDEVDACIKLDRENQSPEIMLQAAAYRTAGYPKHNGLCETGVLLRRHNSETEAMNNYWWSEYCRHSSRDQLSFIYVVNKLGIKVNVIAPTEAVTLDNRWGNSYFTYHLHAR